MEKFPELMPQLTLRLKYIRLIMAWLRATSVLYDDDDITEEDELEAYQLFYACSETFFIDLHTIMHNDFFLKSLCKNATLQSHIAFR